MVKKIGDFFTTRGFHYRGELVNESKTHWTIFDFEIQKEIDLLKGTIEKVVWSEVD